MKTIKVYNIDWDTDGEIADFIPSEIVLNVTESSATEDAISDWLSDTFDFCHNGFDWEEV